jgi:hypothetical protein
VWLANLFTAAEVILPGRKTDAFDAVVEPCELGLECDLGGIQRLPVLVDVSAKLGWDSVFEDRELELEGAVREQAPPMWALGRFRAFVVPVFVRIAVARVGRVVRA